MKRTSLTHPLQIAIVSAGPDFGRVGITFCPGKYDRHAMTGEGVRDLSLDLDRVRDWGAAAVVTLLEPDEVVIDQFDRDCREIIDEIEWVLDLVRDTGGELAERGQLLSLHETILCGPQIFQRSSQFARSGFHAFEQTHILNCNRGLVGKNRDQCNLLIREWTHLAACQGQNADRSSLA